MTAASEQVSALNAQLKEARDQLTEAQKLAEMTEKALQRVEGEREDLQAKVAFALCINIFFIGHGEGTRAVRKSGRTGGPTPE